MKNSKSNINLFEIGSTLDEDVSWSFVEEKHEAKQKILHPNKHFLYFRKEKRRGKTVTLIGEFFLIKEEINTILSSLKKYLGVGGSFKNGFIELQGECEEKVKEFLKMENFRFKNQ